jgi:hypothetical protein
MGNPIGKENVMMAESSSDGDPYHNGTKLFIVKHFH